MIARDLARALRPITVHLRAGLDTWCGRPLIMLAWTGVAELADCPGCCAAAGVALLQERRQVA